MVNPKSFERRALDARLRFPRVELELRLSTDSEEFIANPHEAIARVLNDVVLEVQLGHNRGTVWNICHRKVGEWTIMHHEPPNRDQESDEADPIALQPPYRSQTVGAASCLQEQLIQDFKTSPGEIRVQVSSLKRPPEIPDDMLERLKAYPGPLAGSRRALSRLPWPRIPQAWYAFNMKRRR